MKMTLRKIETFVIIVIIAIFGIIYAFTKKPATVPIQDNTASQNEIKKQEQRTESVKYQGVDGKNALELLEASHQVQTKHFSFGDMVQGIDGVIPDAEHFWAFYVNESLAQVGAESYITKSSDTIEWKLEEIK